MNQIKKYNIIYADPPWKYKDKTCDGCAEAHYKTMSIQDICHLRVQDICEKYSQDKKKKVGTHGAMK